MHFSITFPDGTQIKGLALEIIHNGKDITNHTRKQVMECLIDSEDKLIYSQSITNWDLM